MDEKLTDKNRDSRVSMIGPFAALLAAIITTFAKLPPVLQHIMVFLMTIIVVISVYVVFGQQFARFLKKIRVAIKHHFLTKKHFVEFNRFVDKLEGFLAFLRCDNIPYTLNRLQNNKPEFRGVSLPSLQYFHDMFAIFMSAIRGLRRNKENFLLLIKWFESVLNAYNELCVRKPVDQIHIILKQGKGDISEDVKQEYRKNKTVYDRFILDYIDFAQRINKDFNEKIAREYFEVSKEL